MKDRKKLFTFVLFFSVIVVVYICEYVSSYNKNKNIEQSTQEPEKKEINIILPSYMDDKEIFELEVPKIALEDIRGENDEEIAIGFRDAFEKQNIYMQDIYVNDAGKTIMVLNREQLDQYIDFRKHKLQQALDNDLPMESNNVSIAISDDFACVNYYVNENCELLEYSFMVMWIEPSLAVAQTIQGMPSDKWRVKHMVYFGDNEMFMLEFESGAGISYEITNEEWQQKMEEAKELAEGDD